MLFAAENNILVENEMVDIQAHHHEQSLKDKEFVRI